MQMRCDPFLSTCNIGFIVLILLAANKEGKRFIPVKVIYIKKNSVINEIECI